MIGDGAIGHGVVRCDRAKVIAVEQREESGVIRSSVVEPVFQLKPKVLGEEGYRHRSFARPVVVLLICEVHIRTEVGPIEGRVHIL